MVGMQKPPVDPGLEARIAPAPAAEIGQKPLGFAVQSRGQAEYLLTLDHMNGSGSSEWTAFFVESLVAFLVWQDQPWGMISDDDVDWLIGLVADAPSPSVPALIFALVRELNEAPERLLILAMRLGQGRLRGQTGLSL